MLEKYCLVIIMDLLSYISIGIKSFYVIFGKASTGCLKVCPSEASVSLRPLKIVKSLKQRFSALIVSGTSTGIKKLCNDSAKMSSGNC